MQVILTQQNNRQNSHNDRRKAQHGLKSWPNKMRFFSQGETFEIFNLGGLLPSHSKTDKYSTVMPSAIL